VDFFFRLFLGVAIALLQPAGKLIPLARDGGQIIVGQLAPFFLDLARELLPVALDLIPVHDEPPRRVNVMCPEKCTSQHWARRFLLAFLADGYKPAISPAFPGTFCSARPHRLAPNL